MSLKIPRYTQKELKNLVATNAAIDLTYANNEDKHRIEKEEGYLQQIGYSSGMYGCSGLLLKASKSNKLYAVTARTTAIWVFS